MSPQARRSLVGRLAQTLVVWFERLQIWLVVAVFLLLGMSLIDPVRKVVERWVPLDTDFYAWVVAGMFVVTLAILRQLETVAVQILGKVNAEPAAPPIVRNVSDVLTKLEQVIKHTETPEHRTLSIIGLTMLFAWPVLDRWLEAEDRSMLRGWKVRLYIISPEFVRATPSLNHAWEDQARFHAEQIEARIPEAADLGVELSLVRYPVVPAIHGFVVGSGELFISFTWWDTKKGVLDGPRQFYDHFGPEDLSERARQFRALFANHLRHLDSVGELTARPDGPTVPRDTRG